MEITNIRVDSITPKKRGICGSFTIILDNLICIHNILVLNGEQGLYIAFPSRPNDPVEYPDGTKKYFDVVHPTTKEFRSEIEHKVLDKYNKILQV